MGMSGSMLGLPLVVVVTSMLEGARVRSSIKSLRSIDRKQFAWGVGCGVMVSIGYLAYNLALGTISGTITFAIVGCASLVTIVSDILLGELRGQSWRVIFLVFLTCVFNIIAIAILATLA